MGLVLYAVDPAQYDLERGELDAEAICRRVRAGGGNAVRLVVHSMHGHAFFPSEFAPLAPGYEFGRDYVAEFAEACRRHGLGLAHALSVASNPAVAEARPDWRQIAPDGSPHSWGRLPVMCLNTGYLTYLTDIVRELVARYGADCLCLDNLALLDGCRCEGCVSAFRTDTGLDLRSVVAGSGEAARYREWRFERTERLAWNLAMAAKSQRGDISVVFGGCGWSPSRDRALGWRAERAMEWMDNVESGFAPRWYGQDLSEGELIGAYHRALGKPGWCWVEYSPLPYALLACPAAELRLKAGTVLAAGSRPCVWTLLPMPPAQDTGLAPLAGFFAQFAHEGDCLEVRGSFARTGVLLSRKAAETTGRDADETVRGWCHALSREHVLWDFVLDRDLSRDGLSRYRVLIVPGTPYLDTRDLAAITDFVQAGGNAIFVGDAGRFGADGQPLPDFAAADLLGVRFAGPSKEVARPRASEGYLQIAELPLATLARELIPSGAHVPVEVVSAQTIAEAIPGGAEPFPVPRTGEERAPGITWRMQGGGRAVYVAADLEAAIVDRIGPRFTSTERLIGELVRWLGGERIRIEAPRHVSVHIHRAESGATIHLVNRPASGGHVYESVPPSGEMEIVIPQTLYASNVRALDGTPVDWNLSGRRLRIVVSGVEEYRCLRVEGALG